MRIAVFSNVHGNRFTLEAVLRDIAAQKPDALANLGDQVWGGADPGGAWQLQQDSGAVTVRSNTDEFLCLPPGELEGFRALGEWLHAQLEPTVPAALAAFPTVAELAGGAVMIVHGSLQNPSDALMLTREGMGLVLRRWPRWGSAPRPIPRPKSSWSAIPTPRCCSRGTAGPSSTRGRSRGRAMATRRVLLEKRAGAWSVSFRRVPYDTKAAARWALAHCPIGEQEARQLRTGLGNVPLR